MPQLSFVTLDVFTQTRYAGNPLAVVQIPTERDVTTEAMQAIAREFNLSETIFLHEAQTGKDGLPEWRVRIFLTEREIPFAGHPTIGSAVYAMGTIANKAPKARLQANAGPIELDFADGEAKASIPHDFHIHVQYPFTQDDVFNLQPALQGKVHADNAIHVASPVKGMNFVLVELSDLAALATITTSKKPAPRLDDGWNVGFSASYFYVFTREPQRQGQVENFELRTRMIEGALEDPATGSAACALACFLVLQRQSSRISRFAITQGVEMGRQSDIGVEVTLTQSLDTIEKVELSGTAVKVMEGTVEY